MREIPIKGAEEVNCKTVSFTANLSGKRTVFGQNSEKLKLTAPKKQHFADYAGLNLSGK